MADIENDFAQLSKLAVPVKRAAYSDRTAWIMAIFAELAYTPFDEESRHQILGLAGELAELTNQDEIASRLENFQRILAGLSPAPDDPDQRNKALKGALEAGGFKLAGGRVLHSPATDTQGFVAYREGPEGTGMTIIAFRGTKQLKDWMTNLQISAEPIRHPTNNTILGNMHKGFHEAYMSVHVDIAECLEECSHLPLYITGHSLGGALAVVATWYQSSAKLGACYTFGAPRVGDAALIDQFKTPIYRIVNGPDPVPFVPPSGVVIDTLKAIVRLVGAVFPIAGFTEWVTNKLIQVQKFRHYGDMRYLTVANAGEKGDYPKLKVEFALSSIGRLGRLILLWRSGKSKRLDKYHDIRLYRDKLRAHAIRRNQ